MNIKEKISNYIRYTRYTDSKLNKFVPNSHIGKIFSEVYEFIEYYESGDHIDLFNKVINQYNKKLDFPFIVNEVFEITDYKDLTDEIVHSSYQKLREKKNPLRNFMKLMIIEDRSLDSSIMKKRINRGLFKIYDEFRYNLNI